MSYTPNIPQATDNPSNSQSLILQNFQALNLLYGTSGDHYAWTNTTPTEGYKHAKVTLPGLPTTNAPGNAIPAPVSGNCAIFGQTVNSQTTPFVTRDGLVPTAPYTNIWPLLPIKAFATFTLVSSGGPYNANISNSFNVSNVAVGTPVSNITITMPNAMRTTTYGVLAFDTIGARTLSYTINSNTSFSIDPYSLSAAGMVTVVALEP